MHTGRTILVFLLALSLAMLPMARAFIVSGDQAVASEAVVASAQEDCDHTAMGSDVVVTSGHDCCDHEMIPPHPMKGCPGSGDCIAKCFGLYAVVFSSTALACAIGGTEPGFVSSPFHSRTASPPFRPPRA